MPVIVIDIHDALLTVCTYFSRAQFPNKTEKAEILPRMIRLQRDFTKNLQYFFPILTLALGYFYGVSSSARETLSKQNPVPNEIQGPNQIMPILTKEFGNLQLKGWDRKLPEAYGRVKGKCKILA